MDGSNFVARCPASDQDTTAADRAAVHRALCMTTIIVVLAFGAVLAFAQFFPTTYAQMGAWLPAANM